MTIIAKPVLFLAFANDRGDKGRYLRNLPEEARQVQRTLAAAEQRGHCELVLRQNATAGDILDVFQDARYRDRIALFHFGGHADGYKLLLETADGKPVVSDAGGLARFLAQQRELQLVFLNGCSTEGQVIDLLDAGVHVVIATDQAVDDAMATAFATRFYQGLAGGGAIGTAFEQAKAAMQLQEGAISRHFGAVEEHEDASRMPWCLYYRDGAEAVIGWSLPQAVADLLFGMPDLPLADLPDKPYRYLDWYRREDANIFFGRRREIRDLYDRVTATGSSPIVLLYGQSGVGKSSLLAAGLLPRLESSHAVRYARRDQAAGLVGTFAAALGAAPDADLAVTWRALETQNGQPLLVVLDQVEEIFTRSNLQQPDEMARFLTWLEALFADPDRRPQGRLILSFRKEWLAEIKERLIERRLSRGEVFLERLGRQGIAEVVAGPQATPRLANHYQLSVASALPGLIADDLLADRESPVAPMLAILLADMWDTAKARCYEHPTFDDDLYHEFRSRGLSLDDFLGRQLATLHGKLPEAVDSGLALDLLARHTTPLGTAEQLTLADLVQTYQHRQDVLPDLLQECRDLYLLVDASRNQPDQPAASRLMHDTLAPHVRKRFDESDAPGQRARRILESRAVDWGGGKVGEPLDRADLRTIEVGTKGSRALSLDEKRLLLASRKLAQRQQRNRRLLLTTLALLFLILTVIAVRTTLYPGVLKAMARQAGAPVFVTALNQRVEAFEVTNQRYRWCYNAGKCSEPARQLGSYYEEGAMRNPVTGINVWQAAEFCSWIGRRLPYLDEWQRIATNDGDSPWPWGELDPNPEVANLCFADCEEFVGSPDEVGSHPAGSLQGINDIIGNVAEWTATSFDEYWQQGEDWSGDDPAAVPQQVAIVGGSYYFTPYEQMVTSRTSSAPADDVGFRCFEP